MSPNVVCQQSFFTVPVRPPALPYLLAGLFYLPLRPCLHRFLPQPANLFDQPHFCRIRQLQVSSGVFYHRQHRSYSLLDLRVRLEPGQQCFVTQCRGFHYFPL